MLTVARGSVVVTAIVGGSLRQIAAALFLKSRIVPRPPEWPFGHGDEPRRAGGVLGVIPNRVRGRRLFGRCRLGNVACARHGPRRGDLPASRRSIGGIV